MVDRDRHSEQLAGVELTPLTSSESVQHNTTGIPKGGAVESIVQTDNQQPREDRHVLIQKSTMDDATERAPEVVVVKQEGEYKYSKKCCRIPPCPKMMYVVSVSVCLISLVIMLVVGLLVIRPHQYSLRMKRSLCTAKYTSYRLPWIQCRCDGESGRRSCRSSYPCLLVFVTYMDDQEIAHSTQIHDTEAGFTYHKQCSYKPRCRKSPTQNNDTVAKYEADWLRTTSSTLGQHECFYDPHDVNKVVRRLSVSRDRLIHAASWPPIVAFISLVIFLITWGTRGCRGPECCRKGSEIRQKLKVFTKQNSYEKSNVTVT